MRMWEIIDRGRSPKYSDYDEEYYPKHKEHYSEYDIKKMIKDAYECGLSEGRECTYDREYSESRYNKREY